MRDEVDFVKLPCFGVALLSLAFPFAPGCACGDVGSEEDARIAYLGVDQVVVKSLALGFAGFNAATNANIPARSEDGDESGSIDVTGQVDQGASDNKGMRLDVVLEGYSDGTIDDPETDDDDKIAITYSTADGDPLVVDLQLRDIPDGTLEGTLVGTVLMEGDLEGELALDVAFSGTIVEDEDNPGETLREDGTTEVNGTAESQNGSFDIDTTI